MLTYYYNMNDQSKKLSSEFIVAIEIYKFNISNERQQNN